MNRPRNNDDHTQRFCAHFIYERREIWNYSDYKYMTEAEILSMIRNGHRSFAVNQALDAVENDFKKLQKQIKPHKYHVGQCVSAGLVCEVDTETNEYLVALDDGTKHWYPYETFDSGVAV